MDIRASPATRAPKAAKAAGNLDRTYTIGLEEGADVHAPARQVNADHICERDLYRPDVEQPSGDLYGVGERVIALLCHGAQHPHSSVSPVDPKPHGRAEYPADALSVFARGDDIDIRCAHEPFTVEQGCSCRCHRVTSVGDRVTVCPDPSGYRPIARATSGELLIPAYRYATSYALRYVIMRTAASQRPRLAYTSVSTGPLDLYWGSGARNRERETDSGAPIDWVLGPYPAAVVLHEPAGDRKAEAGSAGPLLARFVVAPEPLEHAVQRLGGKPRPRVFDRHDDLRSFDGQWATTATTPSDGV
jgi:hypothetical protein